MYPCKRIRRGASRQSESPDFRRCRFRCFQHPPVDLKMACQKKAKSISPPITSPFIIFSAMEPKMRRNSSFRRRSSGASANRTRRSSVAFREQVLGSPSLPAPIQKMLDGIERQLGIRDWSLSTLAAVALSRRAWMIPVLFVLLAGFVIAAGGGGGTVNTITNSNIFIYLSLDNLYGKI